MQFIRFSDLCAAGSAKGKRVFIRADLNVPQDDNGNITEDTRIRASIPCIQMALDPAECVALEPALGHPSSALGKRMVGGVHTPSEEVGDCYRFCVGLERRLQAMGVRFALDTQIRTIVMRGKSVVCAVNGGGEIAGDRLVFEEKAGLVPIEILRDG